MSFAVSIALFESKVLVDAEARVVENTMCKKVLSCQIRKTFERIERGIASDTFSKSCRP